MQIMMGYHCNSDSFNLGMLHNVRVFLVVSLVVCMLGAALYTLYRWYSATALPGRPSSPPDSTLYPTMLTVATS